MNRLSGAASRTAVGLSIVAFAVPLTTMASTPPAAAAATGADLCAQVGKKAGFTVPNQLVTAVAVALAESSCNPKAVNNNTNGSVDRGLWQVNSVHSQYTATCLFTPQCNANAAYAISSHGTNWHPWVTFNTGAYKSKLPAARAAVARLVPPPLPSASLFGGSVNGSGPVASAFAMSSSAGGTVRLRAEATNTSTYQFGVSPASGVTIDTSQQPATPDVAPHSHRTTYPVLPANASSVGKLYTFSLVLRGPGGTTNSTFHVKVTVPGVTVTPPPAVTSIGATPSQLTNAGGAVTLSATATGATSYSFSVSPTTGVTGIPSSTASSTGSVSVPNVGLPANGDVAPVTYTFSVSTTGPGGGPVVGAQQATVTVAGTNPLPPVAAGESYEVNPGNSVSGNLLTNDTTTNGPLHLHVISISFASSEYSIDQSTGAFTYNTAAGASSGDRVITYKAVDASNQESNQATATIHVNNAPVATTATNGICKDKRQDRTLSSHASDPDNNIDHYTLLHNYFASAGVGFTFSANGDHSFLIPASTAAGTKLVFDWKVTDKDGLSSATATETYIVAGLCS